VSFIDILRAEFKLEYNDVFRRKSVLVMLVLYPYIFTLFTLFIGYAGGSPEYFTMRVKVEPVVYLITASYMLMSIFASIDVLLWRPLYDERNGTLIYIIASPVSRLKYYMALPFPRFTELLLLGSTSILPVYTYYYGLDGLLLGILVMLLISIGCVVMIPFAIVIVGLSHRIGESWRVLNIVRPLIMVVMGIYYPRVYMPLAGYIIGGLIPSSHIVEVVQGLLMGFHSNYFMLLVLAFTLFTIYLPLGSWSIGLWEKKKVREGVKTS